MKTQDTPTKFIENFGLSDIGLVRQNNEDMWDHVLEKCFFVLADGMGGHKAGEVAAKMAVDSLCEQVAGFPFSVFQQESLQELRRYLIAAIAKSNQAIYTASVADEHVRGMGTTLCCFMLVENILLHAHIGDSRIYRFREGTITLLTQDHSLRRSLIDSGQLDCKKALSYPYKNVITRALGTGTCVEPDISVCRAQSKDLYFLCSDGLTDALEESHIQTILSQDLSVKDSCEALVSAAKSEGGNDNITIVMIKVP